MNTRRSIKLSDRSWIEILPTEMLLEIFEYLDPWSVRRCSETCLIFFHVTLRNEFRNCFRLNMLDAYLGANRGIGNVFTSNRTMRKFNYLSLERVIMKTLPFSKNFLMRMGKDVTELYLDEDFFEPRMMVKETAKVEKKMRKEILKNFPQLKKLVVDEMKTLEKLTFFPSSLTEVKVGEITWTQNHLAVQDFMGELKTKKGAIRLESLVVTRRTYSCNCFKDSQFHIQEFSDEVHQILHEIGPMERVSGIEANCNVIDHKKVMPSCITGILYRAETFSFQSIEKLANLEMIRLIIFPQQFSLCFLNHHEQRANLSKIKFLSIDFIRPTDICNVCLTIFLSSFPGLVNLSFTGNLTDEQTRVIFTSMPNLKDLSLTGQIPNTFFDAEVYRPGFTNEEGYLPESIENLKKLKHVRINTIIDETNELNDGCLTIQSFMQFAHLPGLERAQLLDQSTLSLEGIKNMISNCPRLKFLTSASTTITNEMVRKIVHGWPEMQVLALLNTKPLTKTTLDEIKANCRYLKLLMLMSSQPNATFAWECSMFENISPLNAIISGTGYDGIRYFSRGDFYEQATYIERFNDRYPDVSSKRKRPTTDNVKTKRQRLTYTHPDNSFDFLGSNFMDTDSDGSEEQEHQCVMNGCPIA